MDEITIFVTYSHSYGYIFANTQPIVQLSSVEIKAVKQLGGWRSFFAQLQLKIF